MKNCIYILVILLTFSCQRKEGEPSLEQQLLQLNERGFFNGAIIVTENDSIILSKGFGFANFESKIPFETNTSMDTGSITKTFTALAMLMLADSTQIDLNTPVNEFIRDFPYESITIRHLLEQTSGIASEDVVFEQAEKGIPLTNETFLDFLLNEKPKLEFEPGSQFMYNGTNHRLLAMIIEEISKASYEAFINAKIAQPLGLENWFLRSARLDSLPKDRAIGYTVKEGEYHPFDSDDFEGFYGDCNLFFSTEDLSKWSRSFLSNSLYPGDKLTTALKSKGSASDFNLLHWYNLDSQKRYHFTGDWKGFYTMVYFDADKKRTITHLTNTNTPHWLRPAIVRNINLYLDDTGISDWEAPEPTKLSNEEIVGSYLLKGNQNARIIEDDGLKIDINDRSVRLFKLSSNFYYAPGIDQWIWFSKDENARLNIHCSSIYELIRGFKIVANNINNTMEDL
ncbi:serine hydrolase domain-containing protein [Poritiphilus flavus]|uniref:Serine hydrolase n=1 Tax=Poritiphilus flavus TaxID=2697053 RepID=A0A6L9EFY5_9FLAO|nr:serine hydrolase domain-containing protein [Poritiphilus flavus]NAS13583.1 serine hydrolase [Poritiphilus flavus]